MFYKMRVETVLDRNSEKGNDFTVHYNPNIAMASERTELDRQFN